MPESKVPATAKRLTFGIIPTGEGLPSGDTTLTGSPITSPKSRYLQWRAVLTGTAAASPTLTSIASAYLPRNVRPQVVSITVHPPGVVFQKPFSSGETEIAGLDDEQQDRRASAGSVQSWPV